MEKEILIFTNSEELVVDAVSDILAENNENVLRIDTDTFLEEKNLLKIAIQNNQPKGYIKAKNRTVDISKVKSVWYRRTQPVTPTKQPSVVGKFQRQETESSLWSLYTALDDVYWLNHPLHSFRHLEHNKLRQQQLAERVGLNVPPTILTNDPEELIAFSEQVGGKVALKTVRSRAFKAKDSDDYYGIYTNIVSADYLKEHKEAIQSAPVFAQQYIEKQVELRVTVVGERIFACAIHSQMSERTKIDWRHYDNSVRHESYELPSEIKSNIVEFMRICQIDYGAIDMIVTPDNQHVFLEVNPSGQYLWIENLANPGISKAIAKLLASPPTKYTFF